MSKIQRYQGDVRAFASAQQSGERYIFGDTTKESDSLSDQLTTDYLRGWAVISASDEPPLEWFNAVAFTATQFISYLHQSGIPEWNGEQEYHDGSQANFNGQIYTCLTDDHTSVTTPNTDPTNWKKASAGDADNADKLDGQHGSFYRDASNLNTGTVSDSRLPNTISSDITGNAATADNAGDSDKLDGQHGNYYRNASNLNSGTVPDARLPSATTTQSGIVEKATNAEAENATANKFPDAAGVHAAFNQYGVGKKAIFQSGELETRFNDVFARGLDVARAQMVLLCDTGATGKILAGRIVAGRSNQSSSASSMVIDVSVSIGSHGNVNIFSVSSWGSNASSSSTISPVICTYDGIQYLAIDFGNVVRYQAPSAYAFDGYDVDSDLQVVYRDEVSNIQPATTQNMRVNGDFVITEGDTATDSDKLDGQHGSFYRDASNLNSGTIPSARLPDATLTQKGVVEKATTSEAESGASNKFPDAAGMIAAISAKSLGTTSQDYTDVSSIRQAGVVYTNTDSAPRFVTIADSKEGVDNDRYQVRKDSSSSWVTVGRNSYAAGLNVGFIVPPGFQYRANSFNNPNHWSELSL